MRGVDHSAKLGLITIFGFFAFQNGSHRHDAHHSSLTDVRGAAETAHKVCAAFLKLYYLLLRQARTDVKGSIQRPSCLQQEEGSKRQTTQRPHALCRAKCSEGPQSKYQRDPADNHIEASPRAKCPRKPTRHQISQQTDSHFPSSDDHVWNSTTRFQLFIVRSGHSPTP